jgi:hypothetical protein
MRLNRHNSRQRQSGAADWLRYVLVVFIAVLALDLTRRFVKLYQRGKSKPAPVAVQPIEPEPTNEVALLPPAKAMPLPTVQMTPAPEPAGDDPDAPAAAPQSVVKTTTNPPPRAGKTMTIGVASGRVQADYVLPRGKGLLIPITVFKPGAITLIALPGDDGGASAVNP